MDKKTAVIITDTVQKELFALLKAKGFDCEAVDGFRGLCNGNTVYERVILPFPSKKYKEQIKASDGEIYDSLKSCKLIIGGMLDEETKNAFDKAQIKYLDYFKSEAYVLKNAYLTTQAALRLLLENTTCFLPGKKVLITGFGRIGKSLALSLKTLGMKVFVAARREEALADAKSLGFETFSFSTLPATVFYYDYIFNTVPSPVFSQKDVTHVRNDATYFELASAPFGACEEDFNQSGKNYIFAGGLPGKYYPAAAAINIADYIICHGGI